MVKCAGNFEDLAPNFSNTSSRKLSLKAPAYPFTALTITYLTLITPQINYISLIIYNCNKYYKYSDTI
jgi:hypothetical protein